MSFQYDVVVVGAGHAGCEASLACARLGLETILFTVSMDSVALMPCNPNIGGSSKGHLVREIDALGGEMGKNIDKTYIQSKMLNQSKGPAVHSLRAQADKQDYTRQMRFVLENTEHLTLKQSEVCKLITEDMLDADGEVKSGMSFGMDTSDESDFHINDSKNSVSSKIGMDKNTSSQKIAGVQTITGAFYKAKAVILCTGVYLKARCIHGDVSYDTGPNGLSAANHLSDSLRELGIELYRFKTGTPARIDKRSIDFSKMEEQFGDEKIVPFSFTNKREDIEKEQVSCWLTYTNETTHEIIRANLDRSPLYSGNIKGTGPRYCPSIEDKVVRFAEKERHQVFIEPEGNYTNEMYIGGMSSSLPEDVQIAMYRSVKGLENAKIVRNAYAIEYDCINPLQLKASLEFKKIEGLFAGGQFNGSSGYEEAACQGLIAGINAARKLQKKEPIILDRSQAYIGVLIDDLVTKGTKEPYRMMTSRAEYRLMLRQDNADMRLTEIGHEIGLISEERYQKFLLKKQQIAEEMERVEQTFVGTSEKVQQFMKEHNSTLLTSGVSLGELIRRPELDYEMLAVIDKDRPALDEQVTEQVNINIKYEGYIKRQLQQIAQFKKLEKKQIPEDLNYDDIKSLRKEACQKLKELRPVNVGQAGRISGVSPADINVLVVYIEQYHRSKNGIEKAALQQSNS